jgi:hypothetical protein
MKLSVQAPVTLVLALNLISCSEPVSPEVKRLRSLATEISTSPVLSPTATVDGVSNDLGLVELRLDRPVASAGEKVVVLGKGLQAGMEVEMSDHKIPIVLTENNPGSVSGTFTFPSGLAPGQILVQIRSLDRVVAQLPIIHDAGDYPLVTAGADKVCAGERFRDANGNLLVGTRPCPFFEPCRAEGQSNCLIANDFILVDRSNRELPLGAFLERRYQVPQPA